MMITSLALVAALASFGPAISPDDVFTFLTKIAPILAALGLWTVLANLITTAWDKLGEAIGKTPTKADDFVYHLVDPAVQEVKRLIAAGDVDAAHQKLDAITALAKKLAQKG